MTTIKYTYRHDLDAVFAKLTSADHLKRRSEAAGHRNVQARATTRDDVISLHVERDIESNIPSFAKKFVDPVNHVVDAIEWRSSGDTKRGSFQVKVSNRIRVRGELSLEAVPGGCQLTNNLTAEVDVPLVGGRIAKIVESEAGQAIEADSRFTEAELDAEHS